MILAEYRRFLATLEPDDVTANEAKVANLILEHIDTLRPLTTARGQRAKKTASLAQSNWDMLASEIDAKADDQGSGDTDICRLTSLTVGPFRGFCSQEVFDLNGRHVLIYGPNGTGKSSFCEALEYSLLGNVADAESKRFRNQNDYFRNIHKNTYAKPLLSAIDHNGEPVAMQANEALYRFCFIEKNRIDGFARIAAQTPARQGELVSILFGLEDFANFVGNFTREFDDRHIDLTGKKAAELQKLRQELASSEAVIKDGPETLKSIEADETKIAASYKESCTYQEVSDELLGTSETDKGLIAKLDKELSNSVPQKTGLTVADFEQLNSKIEEEDHTYTEKAMEFAKAGSDISYMKLYEAITDLSEGDFSECPACKTPADKWARNPIDVASEESERLRALAALQAELKEAEKGRDDTVDELKRLVTDCGKSVNNHTWLQMTKHSSTENENVSWWRSLHDQQQNGQSVWNDILKAVTGCEQGDKDIVALEQDRSTKRELLTTLRGIETQITTLRERRRNAQQSIDKAQSIIQSFEKDNAELIKQVEDEKALIARNQEIATAYASLMAKLIAYKDKLPSRLVSDLSTMVVQLYNAFNTGDPEQEKLHSIALPLDQNDKMTICFNADTNKPHDALLVLSEGHIRCLGLAILAAKNLKEACPFLIFDDPVNAIDNEHREAIRRVFFEGDLFADKQIVLACHGEEFFKDIQNLLPQEAAKETKRFSFLPKLGDGELRIDHGSTHRNYIIASRDHFDRGEVRDSLAKSRRALETLTKDKLWRLLSKFGDSNLSIKMRFANAPIELRNLAEQLRKGFNKEACSLPEKTNILEAIDSLLGISGESREWRYLNKGTHEESDREEFDRLVVGKILEQLEKIDAAVGKSAK